MLERLEIHHYALIEDSSIEFTDGFSVITGETGAGKSIILGALSLLLGEKTEVQSIRSGCDSATVSASFFLKPPFSPNLAAFLQREQLSLNDESLVVSRTIKNTGRSSITIQGRLATRTDLAGIASELLDISAQRDHQSLLSASHQLAVLDAWGDLNSIKQVYRNRYDHLQTLKEEERYQKKRLEDSRREEEFLRFAVDEITKINPKPGEDDQLAEEIHRIASFEQIYEALGAATGHLHGGDGGANACSFLTLAQQQLSLAVKSDATLAPYLQRLESSSIEVQDIYESLRDYLSTMSYSETELDRLQGRLAQLQRLKKKYGYTLDAVIAYCIDAQEKLNLSEEGEILLSKLAKALQAAESEMLSLASDLRKRRMQAGSTLSEQVQTRLRSLGMQRALFTIGFTETEPNQQGADEVSFQICANPGLESRSIKDVASGGELSRIMLAVKTTLAESDRIPTLLFDEVDAGIGGSVALSVADALVHLACTHQVIVITHLASIASKADQHLVVKKEIHDEMSYSLIEEVSNTEREKEIARMLSGDAESQESLDHARKLLEGKP